MKGVGLESIPFSSHLNMFCLYNGISGSLACFNGSITRAPLINTPSTSSANIINNIHVILDNSDKQNSIQINNVPHMQCYREPVSNTYMRREGFEPVFIGW